MANPAGHTVVHLRATITLGCRWLCLAVLLVALGNSLANASPRTKGTADRISQQSTLSPTADRDLGYTLYDRAVLSKHQGHYGEAEQLYNRSLAILRRVLGPTHSDIGVVLSSLAGLYEEQGHYSKAEQVYKQALALLKPKHEESSGSRNWATTLNNLAWLYTQQQRVADAEPLYMHALAIRKALDPQGREVVETLNNMAVLEEHRAHYAEAEGLYKQSLEICRKKFGADALEVAAILGNLALLYETQGRYAEAEPLLERALAIKENLLPPEHPDRALVLNNLAGVYEGEGRVELAESRLKQALEIWRKILPPDHPDIVANLGNLGVLYDENGRYAEAEPLLEQALEISKKAYRSNDPSLARSLNNLGSLYLHQGRYADAEPLLKNSAVIFKNNFGQTHPFLALVLENLATLEQAEGNIAAAFDFSREAVEILARHFERFAGKRGSGNETEQKRYRADSILNVSLAHAAAENNTKERNALVAESFLSAQFAQISSAGQAVAAMTARLGAGNDAVAQAVREQQDLVSQWQRLDADLGKTLGQSSELPDATARKLRRHLDDVSRRIDVLNARIAKEFPEYAQLSNPTRLSVKAAQSLLDPDEALLLYLVGDTESWLWVLRRDRAAEFRLDISTADLKTDVAYLRRRLDPTYNPYSAEATPPLEPFPARRSYALFQKLMAPATAMLAGIRRLVVVPDGPIETLPLSVLVTEEPVRDPVTIADHRNIPWLGMKLAMTTLPLVSSLQALRTVVPKATKAPKSFVGIGDPALEGTSGSDSLVKIWVGKGSLNDEVRSLPPLPETAEELKAIATATEEGKADLYLWDQAREPLLRSAGLDQYRTVMFATHGLVAGELRNLVEPALVLTPPPPNAATAQDDDDNGLLTASKVATLKLDAEWVVLSACDTASSDGTRDGGSLSGLARAFLYAGARSLLVSHWKVPSQATVTLTTGAFQALARDPHIGRAEALRRSMSAMLAPDKPDLFAHPLAWAPFVVVGEGSADR